MSRLLRVRELLCLLLTKRLLGERIRPQRLRQRSIRGDPPLVYRNGGPALVGSKELLPVRFRGTHVRHLVLHRRVTTFVISRQLLRPRLRGKPARPVIAHTIRDVRVVHHRDIAHIHVTHKVYVDPVHLPVVVKVTSPPVAALVAIPGIPKAIRDPAIKPDMRSPESVMEPVPPAAVAPVSWRPKVSRLGWRNPHARHPEVAAIAIVPIPRRPLVISFGQHRLLILRKRRRCLIGVKRLPIRIGVIERLRSCILVRLRRVPLLLLRRSLIVLIRFIRALRQRRIAFSAPLPRLRLGPLPQHARWLPHRLGDEAGRRVHRVRIPGQRRQVRVCGITRSTAVRVRRRHRGRRRCRRLAPQQTGAQADP